MGTRFSLRDRKADFDARNATPLQYLSGVGKSSVNWSMRLGANAGFVALPGIPRHFSFITWIHPPRSFT
jgi:hypothetical protein